MGLRYQKRIKLGKLLQFNISKTGVGLSVGIPGLRFSTGPRDTRFTFGLPGTGLSYTKHLGSGRGFRWFSLFTGGGDKYDQTKSSDDLPPLPSPGLLASYEEKELSKGLENYWAGNIEEALDHFLKVASKEHGAAIMAAEILIKQETGQKQRAISLLEKVLESDAEFPTPLMQKYLADVQMEVPIIPSLVVHIPIEGLAAVLMLVELYQLEERLNEAIGLLEDVEKLANDPALILSLCDLYAQVEDWEAIIQRSSQVESEDNVTLATMIFYGIALLGKGMPDAAISVFSKTLRRKKDRSPELLRDGQYWRAVAYQETGKGSRAREEFEKLYAEDPNFRDVAEKLA
jgi:tetratricopeptide (TPR) repeat protein